MGDPSLRLKTGSVQDDTGVVGSLSGDAAIAFGLRATPVEPGDPSLRLKTGSVQDDIAAPENRLRSG